MRYLIIGSGIAGVTAAKTIRQHDANAEIRIYSDEYHPLGLYARKNLARGLANGLDSPEAFLVESAHKLERQKINFVQQSIPCVYPQLNQIFVNHAFRANYDRLLIATGATPMLVNAPGHHVLGVHQLRNYDDASLIEDWLPDLRQHGAVVIGAGILGVDVAYALSQRNIPVTMIVRESRIGMPLLSEVDAARVEARLRDMGVTIEFEREVRAFLSEDGKLLDAVELDDMRIIQARMALCCIGVRPTTDFLEGSGIALDETTGGVIVNSYLQTNIPNIYAAGSCALTPAFLARTWATAAEQGQIAALNMLGQPTHYNPEMLEKVEPLALELAFS